MVFWKGFGKITNDCKRFRLQNLLWWLGRRGADQWRSTNHWKGSWMVRLGPKRLGLRCGWFICIALFYEFFLGGFFFTIFGNLMPFWRVLGGPNGNENQILRGFLRCFFRVRLGMDFLVFFSCFFRVQTLIFVRTASVLEHFHKIDGFLKSNKKNMDFGSVFGSRNGETSRKNCVEKH